MDRSPLREEIERRNRTLVTAFDRRDERSMAELFTADAQLFPPGREPVSGTERIAAFWKQVFGTGVDEFALETIEVEDCGETAIEVGRYTLRTDDEILDEGTSLVVWKRDDGEWKLHRDIWNSNRSP